ncbi:ABC transporter substrate-binding protein [Gryllotalpicola protaetiae]|uniref:Thiamine pyrimidine synthase n=1 Tax=Gryllotalpicola protaetiae TaxID=2419771 RepID=A0A387BML8_9MICO|nr:ABC transporter substrate-binding protein [Gryllotalpicola protaetiae]AYG03274.1 ABC transporter substrate-binding protein [Gryllotalpicola protaetiae]
MKHSTRRAIALAGAAAAAAALLVGCSSTPASTGKATTKAGLTPVKIQLQWAVQAQFAGYVEAVKQGYYKDEGLDVTLVPAGGDIVPQTQLANGAVDYAIAWAPKALASREQGAAITDVAQIFQRSGTLQISFKSNDITSVKDLKGKTVGSWGGGNEFEPYAAMTKSGLDPAKDVTIVQQGFDMNAFLDGDIKAAQAMTYNELAQVLESTNPKTGKLYTLDDLNILDWSDLGFGMYQDGLWADSNKLKNDKAYQKQTTKVIEATLKGWVYARDHIDQTAADVVAAGSQLGLSHQTWQTNEVDKLIWPSPDGVGKIDTKTWDQTVDIALHTKNGSGATVITAKPDSDAYTNTYVDEALADLKKQGVDVTGEDFKPETVTLQPGGK